MNLAYRSFPKRQMEITAILTCTLIPSSRGTHQAVVTKGREFVQISFRFRLLGAGRFPVQPGASSRILLEESTFVGSIYHVTQAPGDR